MINGQNGNIGKNAAHLLYIGELYIKRGEILGFLIDTKDNT